MNWITFSFIFLLSLINIVQCKKYLVEVEDKKGDNVKENEESNEEMLEDNTNTESEGKPAGIRQWWWYAAKISDTP